MKRFLAASALIVCFSAAAAAQTVEERVRRLEMLLSGHQLRISDLERRVGFSAGPRLPDHGDASPMTQVPEVKNLPLNELERQVEESEAAIKRLEDAAVLTDEADFASIPASGHFKGAATRKAEKEPVHKVKGIFVLP